MGTVESQDQHEVEWQFDALDVRPVERWLTARDGSAAPTIAAGAERQIVDRYLDTEDWRIYRAGYALRLRTTDGHAEASLKRLDGGEADYRVRREITQPISVAEPEALAREPGLVSDRVQALAGARPLRVLFTFETQRKAFPLSLAGVDAGELTLDETAISMGEGKEPVRLRRVEIEVPGALVTQVEPFVAELREGTALSQARLSKFGAGLIAHGLQPAEPIALGSTAIKPKMTIGEAAFTVLRRHFAAFLAHEPGTRLGDDIEELHDMRVAARRLRAAFSLFRDALPPQGEFLREELRWVASALGAVRDLDVQLEQLASWIAEADPADAEALSSVAALLRQRRHQARATMLDVLDSPRYAAFVAAFEAMLQRGSERPSVLGAEPALAVAPRLIARRYRAFRKLGNAIDPSSPPERYHELRIQGKRLRYALEFLSPLYGTPATDLVGPLVALQDLLGAHQDAYVAIDFLHGLATEDGAPLPGAALFAMGRVAQRYADAAVQARAQFPRHDKPLRAKGKAWKRLQSAMERRQPKSKPSEHDGGDVTLG